MREILQFFIRTYIKILNEKKNYTLWSMIFLSGVAYCQNSPIDSLQISIDTIINQDPSHKLKITVKNDTKIYITEGTITANLDHKSIASENIVYISPQKNDKSIINEPVRKEEESKLVKKIETKPITTISKTPLKKGNTKIQSLPYRNNYHFNAYNSEIACSNNTLVDYKLIVQENNHLYIDSIYDYLYKPIKYQFIFNSYSKYISTLEIRSPALFI